jgi:hypothetical protein
LENARGMILEIEECTKLHIVYVMKPMGRIRDRKLLYVKKSIKEKSLGRNVLERPEGIYPKAICTRFMLMGTSTGSIIR